MMNRPTPAPDETLDQITRDWWIFQLRKGHRFSTDDTVTAWTAGHACPDAKRVVDLAGLGSVGLMTLHYLSAMPRLCFSKPKKSVTICVRKRLPTTLCPERADLRLGDLRDENMLPEASGFDLVTGSPPHTPVANGVVSSHPQRAACRMELRGSVFDYCTTAARVMKTEGTFVFVHSASDPTRAGH